MRKHSRLESASAFEAHHALDDAFRCFGNFALFTQAIRAVLADLARFATGFDRHQSIDLVVALFALHARCLESNAPMIKEGAEAAAAAVGRAR